MELGVAMLLMPWLVALTALACSPAREGEEAGFARAREEMVADPDRRARRARPEDASPRCARSPGTSSSRRRPWREAYEDHPLPIGHGQTISQPYIVGFMTEALGLTGGESVLEVGTGSGYQAAVLAEIAARVHTIEIVTPLAEESAALLKRLGYANVEVRAGDGYLGWPEAAPFDAIVVTAAAPRIPEPLKQQLKDGGRLVLPVGDEWQELVVVTRRGDRFEEKRVLPVRFVPMTGKVRQ